MKGTKSGQTWTWTTPGEYWYDANGARAKSLESGTTTEYVYRGYDPLFEKNTGTGVITDYIYVNGRMMAKQTGSDIYYYIKDALGSTRQLWKHGATSTTFSVTTYAPFGTPIGASGIEKFRFAGELLSGAAGSLPGLYYIGARWMDPELGRWLSLDPELGKLSAPQTMNRYVYCVDNPLKFTDPTGEGFWDKASKWWDKHWKEVAIVALCVATVVTAGALAPVAFAAIGVEVSASVCIASGLVGGTVNAAITVASSGGKASFSDVMKAFVTGGVASAFLPGILRAPTALAGSLGSWGGRGAAAMAGFGSGFLGDVAGQGMGNVAGWATGSPSGLSIDWRSAVGGGLLNSFLVVVPGGENFAGAILGKGGAGRLSGYLARGTPRTLLTPWEHPTSAFLYSTTMYNELLGGAWEKMLRLPRWLPR